MIMHKMTSYRHFMSGHRETPDWSGALYASMVRSASSNRGLMSRRVVTCRPRWCMPSRRRRARRPGPRRSWSGARCTSGRNLVRWRTAQWPGRCRGRPTCHGCTSTSERHRPRGLAGSRRTSRLRQAWLLLQYLTQGCASMSHLNIW